MKAEKKIEDFSAIIFDLDGLVLDTDAGFFAAWQQAAAAMRCQLDEVFCGSLSGLQHSDVIAKIQAHCGPGFEPELFERLSERCWLEWIGNHGITIKTGFFDLMAVINERALPYCLATNSRKNHALNCLRHAGLAQMFPLIFTRDSVAQGKPSPEIFYLAAHAMGRSISDCLVLEDSPSGVLAASRSGAGVVFVPSRMPAENTSLARADFTFANLVELAEFIRPPNPDHV